MPELPEVETVVRDLRPHLEGRRISAVKASSKRLRRPWSAKWGRCLVGRRIEYVSRWGKWIILGLNDRGLDEGCALAIHLGMSGQLMLRPAGEPWASHTHLVLPLDDGRELRFRDIRRFGGAVLLDRDDLVAGIRPHGLGPDPSVRIDLGYWRKCLAATRRCLKAVLLDQRIIAGVGNIYADEALFEAGLHPARLGCDLTPEEAACLRRAIPTVLKRAIKKRGSSIRNYVSGSGVKGEYQNEFRVYGRTGEPCLRCRTPIARIRLAGRSTHFCPQCQPPTGGGASRNAVRKRAAARRR
ncbi:MAG TPA: bifunctional DNA-formamidopyrimidine glycosylase/DNA-(apurinic or apyrimidinic site) lyase [Gemmataceae bacterium]|nr:bifunctional DNA-formamidopyrimidine glycosylase/DNA-(apurinic or apyrimidinic site) lyase [Gemmataceae bacterium]